MIRLEQNRTTGLALALLIATPVATLSSVAEGGLVQRSARTGDSDRKADDLLAEARLHAELGGHAAAADAFARLFEDGSQPLGLRGRARLGQAVMLRELGDQEAWVELFFDSLEIALEVESVELANELIAAAGGVRLALHSWANVEPLLQFQHREDEAGGQWIELPPELRQRATIASAAAAAAGSEPIYSGEPISIAFKNAELQDLFRMFAQISGLNIVWAPELSGETVTLDVTDVPWDQVMALVLKTNDLGTSFDGSVLRIAPLDEIVREQDQTLALQQARELAGPMRSIARQLRHADGRLTEERVRAQLSARGTSQLDLRDNTLIIKDVLPRITAIEALLDELDVEPELAAGFTGEPISVSFTGADVPDLFRMFGQVSGLDIVVDDRVSGTADLAVQEAPWDSVLHGLLMYHGLVMLADGSGKYYVVTRPAATQTEVAITKNNTITVLFRPAEGWGHGALEVLPPIKRIGF